MKFPTIKLLNTVKINGAHFEPHISTILTTARDTAPKFEDSILWVTSANDLTHKKSSKHYSNEAFDLRVKNVSSSDKKGDATQDPAILAWAAKLRDGLGKNYDVVVEKDHLHVEYDPKDKR